MANNPFKALRRTTDFENIRSSGHRTSSCRWMTIGYRKNQLEHFRIGWTVSRKVGSAVIRNRLKRWGREYFRTAKKSLNNKLDVNVVFRPVSAEFYKELKHAEFSDALERSWQAVLKASQ